MPEKENLILQVNSEEVQEIITAVPSWILRRGITMIFTILLAIVLLSAIIKYPDVVNTNLKINSLNSPKAVYAKQPGKIVALLVEEGSMATQNQPLAFMESTANHNDVQKLHELLTKLQAIDGQTGLTTYMMPKGLKLGELQGAFQNFHQYYLQYIATQNGGYYLQRRTYLQKDLIEIEKLKGQILAHKLIQEKEYANIAHEYDSYLKLYKKGIISVSEFKQQENKYLAGSYPLQQSGTDMLNNNSMYAAKQKEILDLDHTIQEEKAKFVQALGNMMTETDAWLNRFVLKAPIAGKVGYAGIIQENQTVNINQELFMINPANLDFFGEIQIPQYNMGKIKIGQRTLVKMKSFPFEHYGLIRGRISYISDVAFKDSVFIAKIGFEQFENKDPQHKIILKNGMQANAEIITEDSSLLQRFIRNITKMLNSN